jgi:hypothetical protein
MRIKLMAISVLIATAVFVGCQTTEDQMMSEGGMDEDTMAEDTMSDEEMMSSDEMMSAELTVTIEVLQNSSTPLAPVAWAVHEGTNPFVAGRMGKLAGLESLAEDGNPSEVDATLGSLGEVVQHGVAATPDGSDAAGPATPGHSYSFTISAHSGQRLSFATMYVQSNDLFYSPGEEGLALFEMSAPKEGDVTSAITLYDAGTEVNQAPGSGSYQAPRQSGPDTGSSENQPVRPVSSVSDGFSYPDVDAVIKVTIHPAGSMM